MTAGFRRPRAAAKVTPVPAGAESMIRLLRSPRVGPATWRRLMAAHGSAEAALDALPGIARDAGVDGYAPCPPGVAGAELRAGLRAGAVPLFLTDPAYPERLAALGDAPPLLWVRGDVAALSGAAVAIVGARAASSLGERMARRLSLDLAAGGLCVVSGLARGIDAVAHRAALEGGGPTVAVLAGGVDEVYPAEHAEFAARIAAEGGAVVSEAPPGRAARASDFPRRNRIVSGLSLGVVVVEAALKSGSLSTARLAAEQGREVMAVPGHPMDARAAGPNALIRDGAVLVTGAADIVAALGGEEALKAARRPGTGIEVNAISKRDADGVDGRGRDRSGVADEGAARTRPHPGLTGAPNAGGAARSGPAPDGDGAAEAPPLPLPPGARGPRADPPHPAAPACPADTVRLHDDLHARLARPRAEDELIREVGLPLSVLAPALLAMELEGRIERLPGARLVAR